MITARCFEAVSKPFLGSITEIIRIITEGSLGRIAIGIEIAIGIDLGWNCPKTIPISIPIAISMK